MEEGSFKMIKQKCNYNNKDNLSEEENTIINKPLTKDSSEIIHLTNLVSWICIPEQVQGCFNISTFSQKLKRISFSFVFSVLIDFEI